MKFLKSCSAVVTLVLFLLMPVCYLLTIGDNGETLATPTSVSTPVLTTPVVSTGTPIPTSVPSTDVPLPTETLQPTLAPPTSVPPTLVPVVEPTLAPPCVCGYNAYNCGDFPTHQVAQTCYAYCINQGYGDVHILDGDSDGSACESLP